MEFQYTNNPGNSKGARRCGINIHLYTRKKKNVGHEENRCSILVVKSILNLARIGQQLDAKNNCQLKNMSACCYIYSRRGPSATDSIGEYLGAKIYNTL
jgi:hypothetical protein